MRRSKDGALTLADVMPLVDRWLPVLLALTAAASAWRFEADGNGWHLFAAVFAGLLSLRPEWGR